jgi:two-component system sensor histidine kinase CpxA
VDDARDREAGGVGLGLAIAQRAIHLHGGTVEAANERDGGLVVTIKLTADS